MRIGVFGGTFDPVHVGHLRVVRRVKKLFGLDEIHLVVAHVPPHKQGQRITSPYHRYAMCVMATARAEGLKASTVELEAPDAPYTIETLAKFDRLYKRDRHGALFFILGADSFAEIKSWKAYDQLLLSHNFIVVDRPRVRIDGYRMEYPEEILQRIVDLRAVRRPQDIARYADQNVARRNKKIYIVTIGAYNISSTEIRRRIKSGQPVQDLVPASVLEYIRKYSVYDVNVKCET
jgi:nicotinate-nucleotide adenylyltransferase